MGNRATDDSWRLQSLTPLDVLPDYDEGNPYSTGAASRPGHPSSPTGRPSITGSPRASRRRKNDGERWRWALAQAAEADPACSTTTRSHLAGFLLSQFGTQTIGGMAVRRRAGRRRRPKPPAPTPSTPSSDDETIARLATGIKRFKLPDEFNPIKIYQAIADEPKTGQGEAALAALASIFENRRQFDRAADYLEAKPCDLRRRGRRQDSSSSTRSSAPGASSSPMQTQPAGRGATVDFRFRNGRRVQFEAHEILFDKLLKDVKDYLTSSPKQLDWQQIDISDIGSRLVAQDQQQYLGRRSPTGTSTSSRCRATSTGGSPSRRRSRRPAPTCSPPGWTAATPAGSSSGSTTRSSSRSRSPDKAYYFVADARTGRPVPRADVELFGWRMVQVTGKNEFRVETKIARAPDRRRRPGPGRRRPS